MIDRLIGMAVTGGVTAAVAGATASQSKYAWIGQFMPMVVGIIMVILVRSVVDMKATKKSKWNYNLLVTAMCALFTGVFVHEYSLSAGTATLFGMGVGAMGVGIIGFGKTFLDTFMANYNKSQQNDTKPVESTDE